MGSISRAVRIGAVLIGLASNAFATLAYAQDAATAEALFRKALDDMDAGRYTTGCPALAESHRLDPRPGTLFTLAECEAKAGLWASAVAHYGDYLSLFARMPGDQRSRQQGRDAVAQQQIAKLDPLVPRLVVVLPPDAPPGTMVRRDGMVLGGPSQGIPLPVNPGEHELVTQAPRGRLTVIKVTVAQGETKRVELTVAPPPPAPSDEPAVSPRAKPVAPPGVGDRVETAHDQGTEAASSHRTWTYILGGLALEGVAVGTATGILAWEKKRVVDRECEGASCSQSGVEAADSARSLGALSTLSFGVGAVSLAGAWLLWVTEPKASVRAAASWQPMVAGDKRSGTVVGVRGGF